MAEIIIVIVVILGFILFDVADDIIFVRAARDEVRRIENEYRQTMSILAARTMMTYEPGDHATKPRVVGVYRGHMFVLDYKSNWYDIHGRTRITVSLSQRVAVDLFISKTGLLNRLSNFVRGSNLVSEEDQIERRFVIKSHPPHFGTNLLASKSLRRKLLETRFARIELKEQQMHFIRLGRVTKVDYLLFLFDLLSDMVGAVEAFEA